MRVLVVMVIALFVSAACGGGTKGSPSVAPAAIPGSPVRIDASSFDAVAAGWRTDFARAAVAGSEFMSGGPGKDGIPAIDHPKFVSVAETTFVDDREPVLTLDVNGDARAYPVQILIWHELVNDVVGGKPVAVSYCPLCNSSVVFDRTVQGRVLDFGVSGLLRRSDLVMFDRQTESWWQQITGEAVVGEFLGTRLEALASNTISFADFRAAHPGGKVLSRDTGFNRDYGRTPYRSYDASGSKPFLFNGQLDERLDPVDRVVTVEFGSEAVAYPFSRLAEHPVVNDAAGSQSIVVFYRKGTLSPLDRSSIQESRDVGSAVVLSRSLDGRVLTFEPGGDAFRDLETGSSWDISGVARSGPLAGKSLDQVNYATSFWFAWAAFKPETRIWQP
ncbi:MAG: DUF3179 domain-containing protein [Chloroflexi bacterium]|nr:DUF3179 domain-containing protein [Chloroflexota bacterium]